MHNGSQDSFIVQVALATPLRRLFDYLPLLDTQPEYYPQGVRVTVPFGKRTLVGIVMGTADASAYPADKLKGIENRLDDTPVLNDKAMALGLFASQYYHHPLGDVLHHMLPVAFRQGKNPVIKPPKNKKTQVALESPLTLNREQMIALDTMQQRLGQFSVTLLNGVTGSGKTEIYLQLIQDVVDKGQQALVLVPEISLTPQTVSRFQKRFQCSVGVLHSNLNETQRTQTWLSAQNGDLKILIGTRSAVFTPMPQLGLIVIDEEHDMSFKQHDGFRYHARDLAIWRAKQDNIPILLGSATPSLETLYHVEHKKYELITLSQRVTTHDRTTIRVVDVKGINLEGGLSPTLIAAIQERLDRQEQVLLFLNRRGYAPVWLCHFCGWIAECPRCDARLTYHQNQRLICHHCLYQTSHMKRCKECGSESHILVGAGTQRVEEVLHDHFPNTGIIRIDRDSTRRKDALEQVIEKVNAREYGILLGTQLLAKGHHFPYVTLVGVIDADSALLSTDFRASERMAQLLTQVFGRAGREHLPGAVIIQTHHPEHPMLKELLSVGYDGFAQSCLKERALMKLPPYSHMAVMRAESVKAGTPMAFLKEIQTWFGNIKEGVTCLGPIPANMEKRQGKFRAQLLIFTEQRKILQQTVHQLIHTIEHQIQPKQVRWSIDIDPQEMS